jgi:hypothetical protein
LVLQDLEGKQLSKTTTANAADLKTLCVGETLTFSSKIVEVQNFSPPLPPPPTHTLWLARRAGGGLPSQVMGTISKEAYHTGKCFTAATAVAPVTLLRRALCTKPALAPSVSWIVACCPGMGQTLRMRQPSQALLSNR